METKAHYVVVGAFALAVVAAAFGFIIWLAKYQADLQYSTYDILFEGPISGLSVAGDVRYNGIKVGEVTKISIDEADAHKVRVRVVVDDKTPVVEGSYATLELQGITGVSFVQITAGGHDMPMLAPSGNEPYPVIEARRSSIQELFEGAPELVRRANMLIDEATRLIGRENREKLTRIIDNVEAVTAVAGEKGPELIDKAAAAMESVSEFLNMQNAQVLAKVLENAETISGELAARAPSLGDMIAKAETIMDNVIAGTGDLGGLVENADGLITDARGVVGTVSEVADKAATTLDSASAAADNVAAVATRVSDKVLNDENAERLSAIIAHAETVTATLSARTADIDRMLVAGAEVMENAAKVSARLDATVDRIDGLAERATSAASELTTTLETVNRKILTDDNAQGVARAIAGVGALGDKLTQRQADIDRAITDAAEIAANVRAASTELEAVMTSVRTLADRAPATLDRIDVATESAGKMLANADGAITAMRPAIDAAAPALESFGVAMGHAATALEKVDPIMASVDDAAVAARGAMVSLDTLISKDGSAAMTDLRATLRTFQGFGSELDALMRDTRPTITQFTKRALPDFASLTVEARELVASWTRISQQIESDPARFLLGNSGSEYRAQ